MKGLFRGLFQESVRTSESLEVSEFMGFNQGGLDAYGVLMGLDSVKSLKGFIGFL